MSFLTQARPGDEPQTAPHEPDPALDPRVAAALARMEAQIDSPETAAEIAETVGLSPRRLETLFREALGTTPAAHALDLRLQAVSKEILGCLETTPAVLAQCDLAPPVRVLNEA